jgi:hypothetical protein
MHDAVRRAISGAIAVNSVQIVFTLLAVLLMHTRGRRFFLLLSCVGMSLASAALGVVFYAEASSAWKIVLVCVYLAFFAMVWDGMAQRVAHFHALHPPTHRFPSFADDCLFVGCGTCGLVGGK